MIDFNSSKNETVTREQVRETLSGFCQENFLGHIPDRASEDIIKYTLEFFCNGKLKDKEEVRKDFSEKLDLFILHYFEPDLEDG